MIRREINWRTPLDAFAPLADEPDAVLLAAGKRAASRGWAYLAAFPSQTLTLRVEGAELDGRALEAGAFDNLQRLAASRAREAYDGEQKLLSGLVGYLGYELGGALEPKGAGPASPYALPDGRMGAYDAVAAFDLDRKRAFISARDARAADRLCEALGDEGASRVEPGRLLPGPLQSNFSEERYRAAVRDVIERIRDGALFQANLSHRLVVDRAPGAFSLFRQFASGDAAYCAILQYREGAIVSNSPERFFRVARSGEGARILAEPIKGTRPRGADGDKDAALAASLLADPKDRAENIMIADLVRNDLSRICRDRSVREEAICALLSRERVHHLVSRISGVLRPGLGPVDALKALFPCGSITGAPKIEAMRVIAEIEGEGRGPYCGAIGYIDDGGAADFSVAIRTAIIECGRVSFPVGGGVTLRSDPQAEYEETLVKARSMLSALGLERPAPFGGAQR